MLMVGVEARCLILTAADSRNDKNVIASVIRGSRWRQLCGGMCRDTAAGCASLRDELYRLDAIILR